MPALCRDCLHHGDAAFTRCPACGSRRTIAHPDLFRLTVAHVDCDAFYASVEKRDRPELLSRPVIVGGGKRGVVAAACYLARTRGVRSAMPMFKALAACPDAVVIRPNMEKYVAVGREFRGLMQAMTPLVEPISIDEAFLDLSGTERLHEWRQRLHHLADAPRDGDVFRHVGPDHHGIRTGGERLEHRHRTAHAARPRDIAAGGDDTAPAATDDHRLRQQFGPVALLDAGVEGVAIDMRDRQAEQLGVRDHAARPAGGAARDGGLDGALAVTAQRRHGDGRSGRAGQPARRAAAA